MMDGALAIALAGLEADPEGAQRQWFGVYKMALVGSARLLRHLAASLGEQAHPLLRSAAGEQALTNLLQVRLLAVEALQHWAASGPVYVQRVSTLLRSLISNMLQVLLGESPRGRV